MKKSVPLPSYLSTRPKTEDYWARVPIELSHGSVEPKRIERDHPGLSVNVVASRQANNSLDKSSSTPHDDCQVPQASQPTADSAIAQNVGVTNESNVASTVHVDAGVITLKDQLLQLQGGK